MTDGTNWTRISTTDDFPNVSVSQKNNALLYRINFSNNEFLNKTEKTKYNILWFFCFFGIPIVTFFTLEYLHIYVIAALIPIWLLGSLFVHLLVEGAATVKRTIELDFDDDVMRIYKNDKQDGGTRKVSRLYELSVEDHPDTEWERVNRHQTKKQGPGPLEKTHSLFAWFGEGGAEKIRIIDRVEWPKRNSLFEVQQATNWAYQRGMKEKMRDDGSAKIPSVLLDEMEVSDDGSEISLGDLKIRSAGGDSDAQPDNDIGGGIKPPLD